MSGVLQGNGKNDGGRLRSWRRILVLAVVMCVSLSAMFFSAWQAEAAVAGAITDLKVSGIGYDQITLGWTTPNDGGSAITEYEIQQNSNAWTAISGSDAGTVDHTVTGLTPGTSDTFKVRAVNGDGNAAGIKHRNRHSEQNLHTTFPTDSPWLTMTASAPPRPSPQTALPLWSARTGTTPAESAQARCTSSPKPAAPGRTA